MNSTEHSGGGYLTNNFVFDPASTWFMCGLYIILGTTAICCNLLDIVVFCTNHELRRKYLFFMALDFGELIDGLCYFLTSIGRGSAVLDGTFGKPISFHACFFERYWVQALIMGTEVPALITIVLSIERILAVYKPKFYSTYVTTKTKILSLVGVAMIELCFISLAGYSAYHNYEMANTRHCAVITSTSTFYATFHFSFVVSAYVVSFICLLTIYIIHRKMRKNTSMKYGNKRDPQLVLFLCVTGTAMVLITFPSIVMLGIRYRLFAVNDIVVGLMYSTPGFMTVIDTILNFIFRPEYRSQVKRLAKLKFDSAQTKTNMVTVTRATMTVMRSSTIVDGRTQLKFN
ncbi:hypothetical protein QR680_016427 [Steinernema hermaphroditum]|uniref:G-protein coupled receptors family 1 profile domain-containing protein n=1 Tax=Steinernema hermaphroditum TaxID=289476 RepID=A0AA39HB74_9BILA|nr:hypothetical protein QR680_016427 [Steinernema hermaphroditum]